MWCIIVLCAAVETNYFKNIGRKCYVVVHASNIIYTLSHSLFLFSKTGKQRKFCVVFKIGMRRVTIKQLKHNH